MNQGSAITTGAIMPVHASMYADGVALLAILIQNRIPQVVAPAVHGNPGSAGVQVNEVGVLSFEAGHEHLVIHFARMHDAVVRMVEAGHFSPGLKGFIVKHDAINITGVFVGLEYDPAEQVGLNNLEARVGRNGC